MYQLYQLFVEIERRRKEKKIGEEPMIIEKRKQGKLGIRELERLENIN